MRGESDFVQAVRKGDARMAQPLTMPNTETQRAAMRKLEFLLGEWSGEASVLRGPGLFVDMVQTESVHFKLDGLLLVIEGVGMSKVDGLPVLQALAVISFNDEAGVYWMRAFNDGRWLETEVTLAEGDRSLEAAGYLASKMRK
jgi:hypothetical protein